MFHHRVVVAAVLWLGACAGAPPEASVRPGINEDFTNAALDVDAMVKRFETESREIFARRAAVARAVGLKPGMVVADVGAGTGIFVDFFARDVTQSGRVYAVEIAEKFVTLLRERVVSRGLSHVEAVLCSERDVALTKASVDVVFTCDTYHHFEYPHSTLASIHRALRANGTFIVVDFERIPGKSRPWLLDHVRCGKEQVIAEVCAAGFELIEEVSVGLLENYFLRFRRVA
ncbi:MAG: class I SAM-dependent methyltransferase [Planctomycetota bacterium]